MEEQTVEIIIALTSQEVEQLERAAQEKGSDIEHITTRIVQTWLEQVWKYHHPV